MEAETFSGEVRENSKNISADGWKQRNFYSDVFFVTRLQTRHQQQRQTTNENSKTTQNTQGDA